MHIYRTKFNLTNRVNNIEDARRYLTEDDMTVYLKENFPEMADKFISIEWKLEDEESGNIILKTNVPLTEKELDDISEWVSGQNSDGLGEGFEQQDFANYNMNDYYGNNYYSNEDEDFYDEDNYVMASFDWRTNEYKFEKIV